MSTPAEDNKESPATADAPMTDARMQDIKNKMDVVGAFARNKMIGDHGFVMPTKQTPLAPWTKDTAGLLDRCTRDSAINGGVKHHAKHVIAAAVIDTIARGGIGRVRVHCYPNKTKEVIALLRSMGYDARKSFAGWRIVVDLNNVVQPDGTVTRVTEPRRPGSESDCDTEADASEGQDSEADE